jgi:hypothetical protein
MGLVEIIKRGKKEIRAKHRTSGNRLNPTHTPTSDTISAYTHDVISALRTVVSFGEMLVEDHQNTDFSRSLETVANKGLMLKEILEQSESNPHLLPLIQRYYKPFMQQFPTIILDQDSQEDLYRIEAARSVFAQITHHFLGIGERPNKLCVATSVTVLSYVLGGPKKITTQYKKGQLQFNDPCGAIQRTVHNLVGNSFKYGTGNVKVLPYTPRLENSARILQPNANYLCLEIHDDGNGPDGEQLYQIARVVAGDECPTTLLPNCDALKQAAKNDPRLYAFASGVSTGTLDHAAHGLNTGRGLPASYNMIRKIGGGIYICGGTGNFILAVPKAKIHE